MVILGTVLDLLRKIYQDLLRKAYVTDHYHFVKSVCIWSYSDPHFPLFGLNTERFSPNAGKCGPG